MREITVKIRLTEEEVAKVAQSIGLGGCELKDDEIAEWGRVQLQQELDDLDDPEDEDGDDDDFSQTGN